MILEDAGGLNFWNAVFWTEIWKVLGLVVMSQRPRFKKHVAV